MPTYLCHGFRWQRRSIRVYVILQNLDDASPDWIIPARTSQHILGSFYEVFEFLPFCAPGRGRYTPTRESDSDDEGRILSYAGRKDRSRSRGRARSQSQSTGRGRSQSRPGPQLLPLLSVTADDSSSIASVDDDFSAQSWSAVKLLEEYDPRDLTAVSRPYAYVADYAVRIDLSCSIADEIARYEQQQLQSARPAISIPSKDSDAPSPGWLEMLRDELQRGEEIRWYVVVNNDEARDWADDRSDPGYQLHPAAQQQPKPRRQHPHPYQYHPQPSRAPPTLEQRHHHAQYLLQQSIFEAAEREKEPEQPRPQPQQQIQKQDQQPGQQQVLTRLGDEQRWAQQQSQPAPEKRDRQRDLEEEKRRQRLLHERNELQRRREQERKRDEQLMALKEQELRKERERQRQREREKEREREMETERQREAERQGKMEKERERELERQREREAQLRHQDAINPRLNTTTTHDTPPMVPEKDAYLQRPRTAHSRANANPTPLRPKMSFDAGPTSRPKTPVSKGGGFRRLFGRGKATVDGAY